MKAITAEWIKKAEADFISAAREYRARNNPNYDAACFFAQQSIEKYLKARLVEDNIRFPNTHDLDVLLNLAAPLEPLWTAFRDRLCELTSYAATFRYPGDSATREMAKTAINNAKIIRDEIRKSRFIDQNNF